MKNKYFLSFILIVIIIAFTSCRQEKKELITDALVSHIDSTIKAGDDFFLYANGKWFRQNPIPGSEQSNGIWQLIQDTINAQIRHVCESSAAIKNALKGSNKQKIGDFFYTGMDSVALNKKGISDLKSDFEMIDAIKDINGIIKTASYIHTVAGSPLFGFYAGQDDKISSKISINIYQGGLSLPDRNFYFDNDSRAVSIRQKFMSHLENAFLIIGYNPEKAKTAAGRIMKLETAIAGTSRKREDTRDPWMNYHKLTFKQLSELTTNIDWKIFMDGVGLHNVDSVIVGQPEFLKSLNGYLSTYPVEDWKNYLKYHLVEIFPGAWTTKPILSFLIFIPELSAESKSPSQDGNELFSKPIGRLAN